MTEKIFWDATERRAVVLRAIELRNYRLYDSPLHVFREAMKCLPPDRHRRVKAITEVPWFEEELNAALRSFGDKEAARSAAVVVGAMRDGHAKQISLLSEILLDLRAQNAILREMLSRCEQPKLDTPSTSSAPYNSGATTQGPRPPRSAAPKSHLATHLMRLN